MDAVMTTAVTRPATAALQTTTPRTRRRWGRGIARMSIRRALFAIPLTAAVSLALFVLASRSPFDPLAGYLGDRYLTMSTADKQRVATELGLDAPWWQQWRAGSATPSPVTSGIRAATLNRSPPCWPSVARGPCC